PALIQTRLRVSVVGWIAIFLATSEGAGLKIQQAPPAPPPAAVTVARPVQREVIEWDDYSGRLDAVEMVEVRARVSGFIQEVHFIEGALVKKGDLLFTIDPSLFQAELDRSTAQVAQAEAQVASAEGDYKRA